MRTLGMAVMVIGALLSEACAPGIKVTRLQPARHNLGATRKVAVLEVDGNPMAVTQLTTELQRAIVNAKYYTLINAMNRGLSISVTGAGTRVDIGGVRQQVDADVYLVARVTRWDLVETEKQEERTEQGKKRTVTMVRPEASVRVSFQVVKADGQVVVFQDYDGEANGSAWEAGKRVRYSASEIYEGALRKSVGRFLSDITPAQVVEKIELDDGDPSLKAGIALAEDGNLTGAEASWNEALQANPQNAGAIYNLGVVYETRGEFDRAAAAYQQAYQINPKGIYRDAIENLNRRISDAESLQQRL